jgi:uncharacterized protein
MMARDPHRLAADIVRDAGGTLVGRTRLQKVAYLAQLAGFDIDFPFEYKHFGPYSEALANAMEIASGLGLVHEEEKRADWGAWYSVYSLPANTPIGDAHEQLRSIFVTAAAKIGAIELELAATAAFLYDREGVGVNNLDEVWIETARLKPEKAHDNRIERAKSSYQRLRALRTPKPLPAIV